jgi:serpin B
MVRVLELHGMTLEEANRANLAWLQSLTEPGDGVALSLANSMWVREGVPVLEGFLARIQEYYQAEVAHLDFAAPEAADTINSWVDQQTRGRIEDIVEPPIDADTLLFLINAVYFKGQWQAPFDPERTRDGQFTRPDGTTRTVPMMSREGTFEVWMGDGPQAVRLPYGEEGRFAMYVFLPAEGSNLVDLLQQVDADTWNDWTSGIIASRVRLQMPRFTLEYEVSLNETLKAMGMEVAFDPDRADFTEMVPREWMEPENVYIKDVKHKTLLEVNEEGTEAAAATKVDMGILSLPPSFTVDRPFLVAIQDDETGIVLFAGAVVDPAP